MFRQIKSEREHFIDADVWTLELNNTTMHFIICVRVAMCVCWRFVWLHTFTRPSTVSLVPIFLSYGLSAIHSCSASDIWIYEIRSTLFSFCFPSFARLFWSFGLLIRANTHARHVSILQFRTHCLLIRFALKLLHSMWCLRMHAHILPVERELYLPQKEKVNISFEGILMDMDVYEH